MKRLRHIPGVSDSDVVRECGIQSLDEDLGSMPRDRVEVDHLTDRMDARIGSPAGVGDRSLRRSAARSPPRAFAGPSAGPAGRCQPEKSVPS